MTDPSTTHERAPTGHHTEPAEQEQNTPHFAPIYTLVNNTSTRTTHHPQVHYIFSDDDPDLLTQALAHQHNVNLNESSSDPSQNHHAILLDLASDSEGGYNVSWASSLSPSWAVLDAQLSRISQPPSDNEGGNGNDGEGTKKKPDRLMLRVDGVETGSVGSERELRLSDEKSGQRSGSGSGSASGSGQRDRERGDGEDYGQLVDEFEKKMAVLRKVVNAGEERRRKIGVQPEEEQGSTHGDVTASSVQEDLRRYADDG